MMFYSRDFTLNSYKLLLKSLINNGYKFIKVCEYSIINEKSEKYVILRHDVDRIPGASIKIAEIENNLGINSTFYFRTKKGVFKKEIIKKLISMGHEIGYHYENLSDCNGDFINAWNDFEHKLDMFRKITKIQTCAMHGAATSKYDNKKLLLKYNYKKLGIICEPYFDIDFDKVLYLTDTGQRWDGNKYSLRDKVSGSLSLKYNFINTKEIICHINENTIPHKIMINIHPERWQNNIIFWILINIEQGFKRTIKRIINFLPK